MNYNIPLIVPKDIMILSVTFSLTELCNRQSDWLTNLYSYRANFVMLYDRYPRLFGHIAIAPETCNLHTNTISNLSDIWTEANPLIYLYEISVTIKE
jgi:hypothetical protein